MAASGTQVVNQNVSIRFDPVTAIFYKYYSGEIALDDILNSWKILIEKDYIPKEVKGFILDYRKSALNMDASEANGIKEFYNRHLSVFKDKKIALIMLEPNQVIFPMLVAASNPKYYPKVFSTEEAAVSWVLT